MHATASRIPFALALVLFSLAGTPASAKEVVVNMAGGRVVIGEVQKLMLEASELVMKRDFNGAIQRYDRVLAMDGDNVQAFLQRSVARREIGDAAGSRADATAAVQLSEMVIQRKPNAAKAYYQRGMGYRLLRQFPQAKESIQTALSMPGANNNWQNDLQAIALEEKIQ